MKKINQQIRTLTLKIKKLKKQGDSHKIIGQNAQHELFRLKALMDCRDLLNRGIRKKRPNFQNPFPHCVTVHPEDFQIILLASYALQNLPININQGYMEAMYRGDCYLYNKNIGIRESDIEEDYISPGGFHLPWDEIYASLKEEAPL